MCFIPGGGDDGSGLKIPAGVPRSLLEKLERKRKEAHDEEAMAQLGSGKVGGLSPFAVFGPRIGVQNISDVRPGERGRRVSVADLKIGLE